MMIQLLTLFVMILRTELFIVIIIYYKQYVTQMIIYCTICEHHVTQSEGGCAAG
jgi:hypothetical protein